MTHSVRATASVVAPSRHFPHFSNLSGSLALLGFVASIMFMTAQAVWAHGYKVGDLEIAHPWSRATPAGAKVAAGYLVIKNDSSTPDRLVSVSADIAGVGEIHEMKVTDGVMTMRPLADGIEIPANGEVKLEPGSYHLMFKDLKRPAKEGEKFAGTLTFEKAGVVSVEFKVDAAAGGDDHSNHGG